MARVKHIVGWVSVFLLVVTLASIWMLTEQSAEQTSLLSESTAHVVEGQAAGAQSGDAGETRATGAAEVADQTDGVRADPLAPVRMWMATNIRRVAHTVEFFFVGLFSAMAAFSSRSSASSALLVIRCIRYSFPVVILTLSTLVSTPQATLLPCCWCCSWQRWRSRWRVTPLAPSVRTLNGASRLRRRRPRARHLATISA